MTERKLTRDDLRKAAEKTGSRIRFAGTEPGDEIEVLPGKAVIEIKPSKFNKGVAVCALMSHAPFLGRKPIFIGDDTTDEAVFAILPGLRGVGFSVGRAMPGADGVIPSPEHVRIWLAHLAASSEATR